MVGRWRNQRDTRNAVTRLGNHLVDLESRQLAALSRLGSLRHLDLYLLGIHQILCGDTKAAAGHLFRLT